MAILEALGVLSEAQDLLNGQEDSTNVILMPALADLNWGEVWIDIITETPPTAAGGAADTYVIDVVISQESTLDTNLILLSIPMVHGDPRISTAGAQIACFDISKMIGDLADASYKYIGLHTTLGDAGGTAGLGINAALSPSKPRTKDNVQVTRSPVGLPG